MKNLKSAALAAIAVLAIAAVPSCSSAGSGSFDRRIGVTETGESYLLPKPAQTQTTAVPLLMAADAESSSSQQDGGVMNFTVPLEYVNRMKKESTTGGDTSYFRMISGSPESLLTITSSSAVNGAVLYAAYDSQTDDGNLIQFCDSADSLNLNKLCEGAESKFKTAVQTNKDGTRSVIRCVTSDEYAVWIAPVGKTTGFSITTRTITITIKDDSAPVGDDTVIVDFPDHSYDGKYVSYSKDSEAYANAYGNLSNAIADKYTDNDIAEGAEKSVVFYKDFTRSEKVTEAGKSAFIDGLIGKGTLSAGYVYYDVVDLSGNSTDGKTKAMIMLRDDIKPFVYDKADSSKTPIDLSKIDLGMGKLNWYPDFENDAKSEFWKRYVATDEISSSTSVSFSSSPEGTAISVSDGNRNFIDGLETFDSLGLQTSEIESGNFGFKLETDGTATATRILSSAKMDDSGMLSVPASVKPNPSIDSTYDITTLSIDNMQPENAYKAFTLEGSKVRKIKKLKLAKVVFGNSIKFILKSSVPLTLDDQSSVDVKLTTKYASMVFIGSGTKIGYKAIYASNVYFEDYSDYDSGKEIFSDKTVGSVYHGSMTLDQFMSL